MRLFDFFIFFLTEYFSRNKRLLTWSTSLERSSYAVGLIVMLWVLSITIVLGSLLNIHIPAINNKIILLMAIAIVGIIAIYLVELIYITKGRYDYITSKKYTPFKTKYKTGVVITIIVLFLSVLLPLIMGVLISVIPKLLYLIR